MLLRNNHEFIKQTYSRFFKYSKWNEQAFNFSNIYIYYRLSITKINRSAKSNHKSTCVIVTINRTNRYAPILSKPATLIPILVMKKIWIINLYHNNPNQLIPRSFMKSSFAISVPFSWISMIGIMSMKTSKFSISIWPSV